MKALVLDSPRRATIPTDTEPNRGRRDHDAGMSWVGTNLVDITVDVDGGLPGHAAVHRPRDAPDVNVDEEHGAVRGRGDRANPERWPDEVSIYQRRACVPCVSPRHGVEPGELVDLAICADAQDACLVRPDVDDVADCHRACELAVTGRDRHPLAVTGAPAKGVSVDDSESTAVPVWRKRSNRLAGELVVTALACDNEQSIAPGRRKYSWGCHRSIPFYSRQ